jgi:hypothetical protein
LQAGTVLMADETRKQPRELDSLTCWSHFTHKENMRQSIFLQPLVFAISSLASLTFHDSLH